MRIGKEKGVPISPELIGLFFEDIQDKKRLPQCDSLFKVIIKCAKKTL